MDAARLVPIVVCVVLTVIFVLILIYHSGSSFSKSSIRVIKQTKRSKLLNIFPRRMWGWGAWAPSMIGYCGECSVQMCAAYYGNYISQEQVIKAAGSSYMAGVNDDPCFPTLHLEWEFWPNVFGKDSPSIYDILNYIKKQLDNNIPVVAGLYVNEPEGDPSFDHQCVFSGYELDDNGQVETLWLLDTYEIRLMPYDCRLAPYECLSGKKACAKITPPPKEGNSKYPAQPFPICFKRREDFANPEQQAPYSVAIPNILGGGKDPKTGEELGSAFTFIKGNVDPLNELYPCLLEMDSVYEPNWGSEDQIGAPPEPISCKVYIDQLKKGKKYSLLRFDNPGDVPKEGNFINSTGYTLRIDFVADSGTKEIEVKHDPKTWPFMSNGTYFFRCVETKGVPMRQNFPYGTDRTDTSLAPLPDEKPELTLVNPRMKFRTEYINRLKSRYRNMVRKGPRVKPPRALGSKNCSTNTVDAGIVCGNLGVGKIRSTWEWTFPETNWQGKQGYGCFKVSFEVQKYGTEAENCVNFMIENDDDAGPELNSLTGVIIYDVDGTNPRLYIEDPDNFYTYAFSPNPQNPDGTWTMLSQDGVTYSTLRPV